MNIPLSGNNQIQFIDTKSVTWKLRKQQNGCLVEVSADAALDICNTLLTGIVMPTSDCGVVTRKDTVCSAIGKLQCEINDIVENAAGIGTVTGFSFTDDAVFSGVVSNPTTTPNLELTLLTVDGGTY